MNPGAPVVKQVFCKSSSHPVGQEATYHWEPNDEEVDQVVENVQHFVSGVQAEAHRDLGEEQEAEILEIPVKEEGSQVDRHAECS